MGFKGAPQRQEGFSVASARASLADLIKKPYTQFRGLFVLSVSTKMSPSVCFVDEFGWLPAEVGRLSKALISL